MDLVYPRCAGIDVHKRTAVTTIGWVDEQGQRRRKTRTFGTMTAEIEQLAAWLVEHGVTHVAMESTGVYWRPVFNLLEPHVEVVLANAAHVKAVPGRKTDVRDSEWLLDLMQHGLIRGGFIPEAPIRALRELTRYRTGVIEERTRALNRIQKVLEDTNIKLASVVSDILGVSGRAMLEALIGGETDPEVLAGLARGTLRKKHDALVQALQGRILDHHRFLLRTLLAHVDQLTESITQLSTEIARRLEPYTAALDLLCTMWRRSCWPRSAQTWAASPTPAISAPGRRSARAITRAPANAGADGCGTAIAGCGASSSRRPGPPSRSEAAPSAPGSVGSPDVAATNGRRSPSPTVS